LNASERQIAELGNLLIAVIQTTISSLQNAVDTHKISQHQNNQFSSGQSVDDQNWLERSTITRHLEPIETVQSSKAATI
jgi:hypothetical protein